MRAVRTKPTTSSDDMTVEPPRPVITEATRARTAGSGTQVVLAPERRRRVVNEKTIERVLRIVAPLVALAAWEVAVRLGLLDDRFFPAPTSLWPALLETIENGTLQSHVRASVQRLLVGFVAGAIPGVAVGLAMGVSKWIRYALQPLFSALYPIPKIAVFPLLILIFGLGETSKILVVALGVFFIVLFNTSSGVVGVPQVFRDASRNFGAKGFFEFRTVALPGAMPQVFTGLRVGMGTAMLVLVSAEFVGSQDGLGYMIWQSWQVFRIENLFIGLTAVAVIGYLMIQVVELVERAVLKWHY